MFATRMIISLMLCPRARPGERDHNCTGRASGKINKSFSSTSCHSHGCQLALQPFLVSRGSSISVLKGFWSQVSSSRSAGDYIPAVAPPGAALGRSRTGTRARAACQAPSALGDTQAASETLTDSSTVMLFIPCVCNKTKSQVYSGLIPQ